MPLLRSLARYEFKYNKQKSKTDAQQTKQVQTQKVSSRKELKDPREVSYTIPEYISKIFHDSCTEELQKEYKGQGILKQLLCIERSLDLYKDFPKYAMEKERRAKRAGTKVGSDLAKFTELMNDKVPERQKEIEEYEQARKLEKEQKHAQ